MRRAPSDVFISRGGTAINTVMALVLVFSCQLFGGMASWDWKRNSIHFHQMCLAFPGRKCTGLADQLCNHHNLTQSHESEKRLCMFEVFSPFATFLCYQPNQGKPNRAPCCYWTLTLKRTLLFLIPDISARGLASRGLEKNTIKIMTGII